MTATTMDIEGILADAIPRLDAIYSRLKGGEKGTADAFLEAAEAVEFDIDSAVNWPALRLDFIQRELYPIIVKWEEIREKRQQEGAVSRHIGIPEQAIMIEGQVLYRKPFKKKFGEEEHDASVTVVVDRNGNHFKYWNDVNVIDEIETAATGQSVKRPAVKGDVVRFTATVKKHEEYEGVKETVVQRARKTQLLKRHE